MVFLYIACYYLIRRKATSFIPGYGGLGDVVCKLSITALVKCGKVQAAIEMSSILNF